MKYGSISELTFCDTVDVEVSHNLIIVPVNIKGETYRFLFDTGAPFSISEEIQHKLNFETITTGKIVDADDNRTDVTYVGVDTLLLGNTSFCNHTAFVADFNANPILQCMGLDGIIGSNFMHHCNWGIDMQKKQITFTNKPLDSIGTMVPFKTNAQYDLLVSLTLNDLRVTPIKLDYGSNGALSFSNEMFDLLLDRQEIDTFIVQQGSSQSGIIGIAVEINEKISPIDSISLGDILFEDVIAVSGNMELLGTKLLSHFKVWIDWDQRQLYFEENSTDSLTFKTLGISISYSTEKGMYVQSIIEGSDADKMGIENNMKVLKVNELNFPENDFCEYMQLLDTKFESLHLILDYQGVATPFILTKKELFNFN